MPLAASFLPGLLRLPISVTTAAEFGVLAPSSRSMIRGIISTTAGAFSRSIFARALRKSSAVIFEQGMQVLPDDVRDELVAGTVGEDVEEDGDRIEPGAYELRWRPEAARLAMDRVPVATILSRTVSGDLPQSRGVALTAKARVEASSWLSEAFEQNVESYGVGRKDNLQALASRVFRGAFIVEGQVIAVSQALAARRASEGVDGHSPTQYCSVQSRVVGPVAEVRHSDFQAARSACRPSPSSNRTPSPTASPCS